jgi:osmotically-inducible protein OsmY
MKNFLLMSLSAILLTGCIFGDRREPKTVFEDDAIDAQVHYVITNDPDEFSPDTHVNITTYNRKVLLTGEVPDTATKQKLTEVTNNIENVQTVYNEVKIGPPTGLVQRTTDTWITTQIKSLLAAENSYGLNQTKVITENNVVYLMGIMTQDEATIAVSRAQGVRGVTEVVKFFEYVAD